MKWEGSFTVPGRPEDLIVQFADPVAMAHFLPGAVIDSVDENGVIHGQMIVKFGPKRLQFRGQAEHVSDVERLSGAITGRGASDVRAARFKVRVTYQLSAVETPDPPRTRVSLVSEAELQGVLAEIARTSGPVVASAILDEFADRFRKALASGDLGADGDAQALSAWTIARRAMSRTFSKRDPE